MPKPTNYSATSSPTIESAALAFLYVTPDYTIELAAKTLDPETQQFTDVCAPVDVLSPPSVYAPPAVDPSSGATPTPTAGAAGRPDPSVLKEEFGIPGAAKLLSLPLPSVSIDKQSLGGVLVIGDEFSAAFTLRRVHQRSSSSLSSMSALQSQSGAASFVDANSPENTKRRKGSAGGSLVPVVGNTGAAGSSKGDGAQGGAGAGVKMVLARQWRVRQGFGEVSGYVCCAGYSSVLILAIYGGMLLFAVRPTYSVRLHSLL